MYLAAVALLLIGAADLAAELSDAERAEAQRLIEKMKEDRRGPYQGVSWFCNDGTVLPPTPYACELHGGGVQYGVLGPDAKRLARYGVYVGTVLASLEPEELAEKNYYRCRALIVETYLEKALDGWVLHLARNYRGFRQIENEQDAARSLLIGLAMQSDVLKHRRSLLVRLMRKMPYGRGGSLADDVRALAGSIGDKDEAGFGDLRFKIHATPEPGDVAAVEAYAAGAEGELASKAKELAAKMRLYYDPTARLERLQTIKRWIHDPATRDSIDAFFAVDVHDGPAMVRVGTELIETAALALRPAKTAKQGERNLLLLHAMDLTEQLWIGVTADFSRRPLSRAEALDLVEHLVRAARPLGWFSEREAHEALRAMADMASGDPRDYAGGVEQLGRLLEWARARLLADLGVALVRYQSVEPQARHVVDDLLRSSLILPLAALLDRLDADIERLRGGGHRLAGLGDVTATSIRGENAGVAVGPLKIIGPGESLSQVRREQIVVLHELVPELPPVAGIITVGSAGSLSHVSLLARNLGIPHASVGAEVAAALGPFEGTRALLGVSAGRRVALGPLLAFSSDQQLILAQRPRVATPALEIAIDTLDLTTKKIQMLSQISEKDSGVRVGPKAAELGRLKRLFPDRVSDAAVIPFGAFVQHVDRRASDGTPSPLAGLTAAYLAAREMEPDVAETYLLSHLETFRNAIAALPFAPGFEAEVDAALAELGKPGTFGVFVRSDTNVEDLKEFTGAGLNLTVPNRVRRSEIFAAIRAVWASPYSERSFRWRQRLLVNPEYVFPSVILHRTVPSQMSGVMVTTDLETGASDALTVSCSEGVAAVVDGGAPETVVITDDRVKLLASSRSATAKRIPKPPRSGIQLVPSVGREPLLGAAEIEELKTLAAQVKRQIPPREQGVPWDIEFGFYRGKAYLMQIRPLKISRAAATHPFLKSLDERARLPDAALDMGDNIP